MQEAVLSLSLSLHIEHVESKFSKTVYFRVGLICFLAEHQMCIMSITLDVISDLQLKILLIFQISAMLLS